MADTTIGRGSFLFEIPNGSPKILSYIVQGNGIKFYDPASSLESKSLFDLLQIPADGVNFPISSNTGHLSLVSLPASPKDAFYNVSLSVSTDDIKLRLKQTGEFAHRASTFFKDLDISFTEPTSGGDLQVEGSVNLILFGRSDIDIELIPDLKPEGLLFKPAASTPEFFEVDQLGRLSISKLEVNTNHDRWADLQALYTFDEPTGDVFLDLSGSQDSSSNAQTVIDLRINGKTEDIKRVSGGISIGNGTAKSRHKTVLESKDGGNKIVKACKDSNALTIAAWIKPSRKIEDDKNLPARIVSLSENTALRNFTLGQDIDRSKNNRYVVRLRRNNGDNNGLPPLVSKPQVFPKDYLDYVVFTRDDTSRGSSGEIYINGVDQTDLTASADLSGDFSKWSDNYSLLLGNEKTKNRPWDGEIHRVAIYSRALSGDEIKYSYFPKIELEAKLTLNNVPAPLNTELPVTINLDTNQLIVDQQGLEVTQFLQFNQVDFTWEQNETDIQLLSGKVEATLWGNSVDFVVSLTTDEFKLSYSDSGQKTLALNDTTPLSSLGDIQLTQISLSANRTADTPAWMFDTDGQVTFAVIPPPLKGPFPVDLFLDNGKLWFSISPDVPLALVEGLQFERADLRFVKEDSGWQVQPDSREGLGGISIPLFGETRPLTAQFAPTDPTNATKALTLEWTTAMVSDRLGKLNLSRFNLKGNPAPGELFWEFEMEGKVSLGLLEQDAGVRMLDFSGLDFSTEDGKVLGDLENVQQRLRLQGKSFLKHQIFSIFTGDLQLQNDLFLLNGHLNLFPDWSTVQVNGEPQFKIAADGQVSFDSIPALVALPDSVLVNPTLVLTDGRLALRGFWLGLPDTQLFYAREREGEILLDGITELSLPFSLNLPAIFDDKTGAQLAQAVQITNEQMNISLDTEFQATGFTAMLNAGFNYTDADNVNQTVTLPERRLYSPPASSSALLGDILAQVTATASELFKVQGRHSADYFVTLGSEQPQIFLSSTGSPEAQISSDMPAIFNETPPPEISSVNSIFTLKQTGDTCRLTLNTTGKDQQTIRTDYDDLLAQVAAKGLRSAGAANLLKRRIAERLPLDYGNLLYYYYGWDVEKGYLDLQAGMRLRVDLQNYQFVQASDPTAQRGFVGSGSFYVPVNSYTYPQSNGGHSQLLGFDPFLSRLQVNGDVDITNKGAGSVFDLLKEGYRKAYYRLFFPKQPSTGSGPERFVTLIGADSLQEMADATDAFDASGSSAPTVGTSFFFRGKAIILPEIHIFVGSTPTYVPVGTTIRQLVETYDDIPSAGLPGQDLRAFSGATRPLRLVHEGVNSKPTYRFINLGESGSINNMDVLDLPLVKGDRFCF